MTTCAQVAAGNGKRIERLPWPRSAPDGTPLGLDLWAVREDGKTTYEHIRRIVSRKYNHVDWLDMDWFIDRVCELIISKNTSVKSAFDPRRSSLYSYVCMVAANAMGHVRERGEGFIMERQVYIHDSPEPGRSDCSDGVRLYRSTPYEMACLSPEDELIEREQDEPIELPKPLWRIALESRARDSGGVQGA